MLPALILAVTGLAAACKLPTANSSTLVGSGTKVLFVGNSYTYMNDVPGLVQAFGESA